MTISRRGFLTGAAAVAALPSLVGCLPELMPLTGETRGYGPHLIERRAPRPGAPNVLMLVLDDQNDWLGYLNPHPGTRSPNLDALAQRSIVFDRAYCAAPKCRPSRTATMFGQMPHRTGVYDHDPVSRANESAFVRSTPSFVDEVWASGYEVFGGGKIFPSQYRERFDSYQATVPWAYRPGPDSPTPWDPAWINPYDGLPYGPDPTYPDIGVDFGPSGGADVDEPDGSTAQWVVDVLEQQHSAPFFLSYGVVVPHLPWRVPQRFFDLHPLSGVVVPDHRAEDLDDLGPYARTTVVDSEGAFEVLDDHELLEEAVQGYQAASTFSDWCVGLVLDALAASPHAENTAVVVWSDHGFHLGEKLHVHKMTLWERACRVPLLVSLPGQSTQLRVPDPVSLLDVGPTIASLTGSSLRTPQDGSNLIAKATNPSLAQAQLPVTTWLEGNHSVRSRQYRYIRYVTGEDELYDHDVDPGELDNVAGSAAYASVRADLASLLPT